MAGQQSPRHSLAGVALLFDSAGRCCLDAMPLLVPPGISPGGNVLERLATTSDCGKCDAGRGGPDSDGWTLPAVTR